MRKETSYKVRFHLAKGPNFLKWQIKKGDQVSFHDPEEVSILIKEGKLINRKSTAKKIHNGANKEVCAWIESEEVFIIDKREKEENLNRLSYNPRVTPNWVMNDKNIDGTKVCLIVSCGRELYGL